MTQAKDPQGTDDLLNLFRRGAESANALLRENEQLLRRIADLESRRGEAAPDSPERDKPVEERTEEAEQEDNAALEHLRELEDENREFAQRYVEIQEENARLVNMYVASSQLHSTLELEEVRRTIMEIVINLVGAEKLAIYVLDDETGSIEAVAAEGVETGELPKFELGSGVVGTSLASGEVDYRTDEESEYPDRPIVCIPLRMPDRPIGAITIYELLEQKDALEAKDHELFTLLGEHASTALFAARLYGDSERRLAMFRGFCELLTE